jgi:hypothetical protein
MVYDMRVDSESIANLPAQRVSLRPPNGIGGLQVERAFDHDHPTVVDALRVDRDGFDAWGRCSLKGGGCSYDVGH